jgi:hypothetical protein
MAGFLPACANGFRPLPAGLALLLALGMALPDRDQLVGLIFSAAQTAVMLDLDLRRSRAEDPLASRAPP